jgi:hypothetical protein
MKTRDFPSVPLSDLMIHIDYTCVPETYSIKPLVKSDELPSEDYVYASARTDALIEKAMENPGSYVLIESMISSGDTCLLALTVNTGTFWKGDSDLESAGKLLGLEGELDEEDVAYDCQVIEEVDLAMSRIMLNDLLEHLGQPIV